MHGNSFANGCESAGSNGDSGNGPQWQSLWYQWLADWNIYRDLEPGAHG